MFERLIDILAHKNWLKEIDKSCDEYHRAKAKYEKAKANLERKLYVLNRLLDAYMERYGEDLRRKDNENP